MRKKLLFEIANIQVISAVVEILPLINVEIFLTVNVLNLRVLSVEMFLLMIEHFFLSVLFLKSLMLPSYFCRQFYFFAGPIRTLKSKGKDVWVCTHLVALVWFGLFSVCFPCFSHNWTANLVLNAVSIILVWYFLSLLMFSKHFFLSTMPACVIQLLLN